MKTLYTAFKGKNNTSYQLVSRIDKNSLFLTNSFTGLEKDITSLDCDFDTVYMFGIDKNLVNEIRIDLCACYNCEHICTDFYLLPFERKLIESNIPYSISSIPTKYLCNAAYYHMLKKNSNTVFIHIPSLRGMNETLMNRLAEMF
ncbi:MAG: hypothetical protein IJZ33_02580 [Clostridia bacterium]|nr:hypothetical protein [Clostridia bacterium]